MTCEEWRNGYKTGFEDGYEKAKRDLQNVPNPLFPSQPMQYEPRCKRCGMRWDKPMGYVCMDSLCPSKAVAFGNPRSAVSYTYANTASYAVNYYNGHDGDEGC